MKTGLLSIFIFIFYHVYYLLSI